MGSDGAKGAEEIQLRFSKGSERQLGPGLHVLPVTRPHSTRCESKYLAALRVSCAEATEPVRSGTASTAVDSEPTLEQSAEGLPLPPVTLGSPRRLVAQLALIAHRF